MGKARGELWWSKKTKVVAMSASRARRSLPQVLLEWLRRLRRPNLSLQEIPMRRD